MNEVNQDTRAWVTAAAELKLAAVIALIAGYVDAYPFLNYRTYASFRSGNTTQTGL